VWHGAEARLMVPPLACRTVRFLYYLTRVLKDDVHDTIFERLRGHQVPSRGEESPSRRSLSSSAEVILREVHPRTDWSGV